ncbi:MAG: riboflavin biosynthesis protein RibF [Chloroflexi bacterium]|nr:riboflavin biosynthesis protein RibF [Chloroflexota bacterium]
MSDLVKKLSGLKLDRPAAVTVGTFDGVHIGHLRLLRSLKAEAAQAGLASIAITFKGQPRAVIDPSAPVTYLATLEQRTRLIAETGVDSVLQVRFDDALRRLSAAEFLAMLKRAANMRLLVTGPGARLGHDRMDAESLTPLAGQRGIRILQVEAERHASGVVSSSAIRRSLAAGDVRTAAGMLGRRYRIDGKVVPGDRRGRELGFPTANIKPAGNLAVPADGIYATVINIGASVCSDRRMAATSIGVRPTFGGGARMIEAYILDFEGDLYGHDVELEFVERLRGEVKFDGVEPLIIQMNRDVSETREVLSGAV